VSGASFHLLDRTRLCGQIRSADFWHAGEVDTAERLLVLLGLLQRRLDWSADELADRLGVTSRTVRRDVTRLRSYGYPVEAFAGHGGGYQLGRGGKLPPLLLGDDETLAVALGLRTVSYAALADVDEAALSALGKIEQLLPNRLRERLDDLDSVTFTDLAPDHATDTSGHHVSFVTLARACATRTTTTFGYIDQRGAASRRQVEPVRLLHANRRWYLVAYDTDRDDWRTFRLDRLSDVDATSERFFERAGPDPAELLERTIPADSFTFQATVHVECSADEARQRVPRSIASITSSGEHCTLLIGTDDVPWLARYLLGLPWSFEVVEPPRLRSEVRTITRAISVRHRRR
jgi:predicted DNA-binding transcriptional regulator YafY